MIVYGQIKYTTEPCEFFNGTMEECREYIQDQDLNDYVFLNIDDDKGNIIDRIVK